jgi:hypothetical protein
MAGSGRSRHGDCAARAGARALALIQIKRLHNIARVIK